MPRDRRLFTSSNDAKTEWSAARGCALLAMKKGHHYERLQQNGFPIPDYGVFDERCLTEPGESTRLSALVNRILSEGSGAVGVRTEPKQDASPLGSYPHIMPIYSGTEVRRVIEDICSKHPERSWWFLVNEAFTNYEWNAVVMVKTEVPTVGGAQLMGEVNPKDNMPLRPSLANTRNCMSVADWKDPAKSRLRHLILRSTLTDKWLEVSSVRDRDSTRIVFWGMR